MLGPEVIASANEEIYEIDFLLLWGCGGMKEIRKCHKIRETCKENKSLYLEPTYFQNVHSYNFKLGPILKGKKIMCNL